ncbi:DNA polymerase III subunit beta [Brevibacillus marinus]|uniref:DNA polymerase III subunit beta n=1 Tax=Brevibacillus marinus TaxID=2496837 RepID=UPI000F83A540|nr:DNA polymerase III subunit beta [Brevibacillus marinus]
MPTSLVKREITITDSQSFANVMAKVLPAVSKNTAVPILTGIHVEASAESITITGSDDNTMIRVVEKGLVTALEPVAFVVPGKMFVDIVKRLPKGELSISVSDADILLQANKSSFELKTMPVEDYPLRGNSPFEYSIEIPASHLIKGLGAWFAASTLSLRPVLQGIQLIGQQGNTLSFVATDAHRLRKIDVTIEDAVQPFKNIIVPAQAAKEMIALLKEEKEVTIQFNEKEFRLITNNVTLSTRLIEGTYPDISRIIPAQFKTSFEINREEFQGALERAHIVAQESKNNVCRFQLDLQEIPNLLVTNDNGISKVKEQVFLGDVKGESLKFAMNTKYLLEALKQLSSKEVLVQANGPESAFVIQPKDDESVLDLILPVRVQ